MTTQTTEARYKTALDLIAKQMAEFTWSGQVVKTTQAQAVKHHVEAIIGAAFGGTHKALTLALEGELDAVRPEPVGDDSEFVAAVAALSALELQIVRIVGRKVGEVRPDQISRVLGGNRGTVAEATPITSAVISAELATRGLDVTGQALAAALDRVVAVGVLAQVGSGYLPGRPIPQSLAA